MKLSDRELLKLFVAFCNRQHKVAPRSIYISLAETSDNRSKMYA